jgi:hypothetical protein
MEPPNGDPAVRLENRFLAPWNLCSSAFIRGSLLHGYG